MQLNNKYFMPAEEFAARHELTTELVIGMIRDKVLGGRLSNDQWFIDLTSRQTQRYLSRLKEQGHVNIKSSQTQEHQTQEEQRENEQPPVRQAWQNRKVPNENVFVKSDAPIAKVLHILGIISIAFGVIVGIALLILFNQPVELLFMTSQAELTFIEVAIALGTTLFYCAYGVLCLGIAKVLELLTQ